MTKLHLDTDIGGDIDDLCALAMILNWPDVDLIAVTTNSDDQGKRAGYARYALRLAGREDIAVAAGADVSLNCYRVQPGLPDEAIYWPEPVSHVSTSLDHALSLLEHSIEQGAIIAAIGALTNLSLLEKRSPGILQRARLYIMGGYVFPPREGFPSWGNDMDWNVQVDVESAYFVLQRSNPVLVPLSVTIETSLRRAHLATLGQSGALAQLIAGQAEAFAKEWNYEVQFRQNYKSLPEDTINFLHDPLACAIALGWDGGVEIQELPLKLEIRDGWLCQIIDEGGKLTQIVTQVDGERFSEFWLHMVASGHVRTIEERA